MKYELLEAAKDYLAQGLNVIPTMGKIPALSTWTEFQHRFVNQNDLQSWGSVNSATGLAAVTGKLSGIVVVDIDDLEKLNEFEWPETVKARTGRGVHLYFFYPPKENIKSLSGLVHGVDIKADGGLATLPPSMHLATGKCYEWIVPFSRYALAPLPEWIVEELKEKSRPETRTRQSITNNGVKIHRRVGNPLAKNYVPHQMIEQARLFPIDEVAEDFTNLKKGGHNRLVGLCPLHDEHTASFTVYLNTNTFYCFGCSKHGDAITLLQLLKDYSFGEAVRNLYGRG
jgi:hypothetical protein